MKACVLSKTREARAKLLYYLKRLSQAKTVILPKTPVTARTESAKIGIFVLPLLYAHGLLNHNPAPAARGDKKIAKPKLI